MSDDEYQENVEALATKRLEKPKKLSAQAMRYWSEIQAHMYHYDRGLQLNVVDLLSSRWFVDEFEVNDLRSITKTDILAYFDRLLQYGSDERKKLSIFVYSAECAKEVDSAIDDAFNELRITDDNTAQVCWLDDVIHRRIWAIPIVDMSFFLFVYIN